MSDNKDVIKLLQEDLQDEHGAIIQYLYHAFTAASGSLSGKLEGIARGEMYHFKWLSEKIIELGGTPDFNRSEIYIHGSLPELINANIKAENDAIEQYRNHQEAIDDEGIKLLLEKIISDEESHKNDFEEIALELKAESDAVNVNDSEENTDSEESEDAPPNVNEEDMKRLNKEVADEYTAILQYLFHSFHTSKHKIGSELETFAIDEMKHMGWLSETIADAGGFPKIEHKEIFKGSKLEEQLKANKSDEEDAVVQYSEDADIYRDEGLKELIEKVHLDETYHAKRLGELIEMIKEKGGLPKGLTIGSLIDNNKK